uniref:Putative homing endonuclease n=1 Tax=viral metagenome TaxID=1070528 RepID=A0A6M3KTS9_9ZZZZ
MPSGVYDRSDQSNWKPNSGRFKKGEHRSPETEFKKGVSTPNQFKKGEHRYHMPHGHGHFNEPEYIKKQSDTHKGQHSSPKTEFKRGEHPSPDTEFKESIPGGVSSEDMQIRNSPEYRYWRSAVYKRDDYTCQQCGKRGGRLEAHHIKPFATHPELRLDVDNGFTLCKSCHRGGDARCRQTNPQ